ncbi:MAG: hypothetical protein CL678_07425 [Bdellovibrionaceae bacterium]|nr:hypothetical protein [Pseudobdellovibrionaceae bacterium]|tara:strand:+ start:2292 stop:5330 length:3039 start_codon:yes stop_codon:yes gene_type:complete
MVKKGFYSVIFFGSLFFVISNLVFFITIKNVPIKSKKEYLSGIKIQFYKNVIKNYVGVIKKEEVTGCLLPGQIFGSYFTNYPINPPLVSIVDSSLPIDLRAYLFKVKAQKEFECLQSQDDYLAHKNDISWLNDQVDRQLEIIKKTGSDYAQIEIFIKNSSNQKVVDFDLSLGIINGTSLIFFDDRPIGIFEERIHSGQKIHLSINKNKLHNLKVIFPLKGFSYPGITHAYFYGLLPSGKPVPEGIVLFPNNYYRHAADLAVVILSCILSILLIIFSFSLSEGKAVVYAIAVVLIGFAAKRSLDLEHIQARFDGEYIRITRAFITFISSLAFAGLLGMFSRMFRSIKINKNIDFLFDEIKIRGLKISYFEMLVFGFSIYLGSSRLMGFVFTLVNPNGTKFGKQLLSILPTLSFSLIFGGTGLVLGLMTLFHSRKSNNEREFEQLKVQGSQLVLFGLSFIIYALSYQNFLTSWLVDQKVQGFTAMLMSQSLPLIVSFAVFIILARTFHRHGVYQQVTPDSIREILESKNNMTEGGLDKTQTEYNWILLNDLHSSSAIKSSNLGIVTHILQSVFHKIHKDYLRDSIHFVNSLGDAILVAMKNGGGASSDPIVSKFIQSYALHVDGAAYLKDCYETIQEVLLLESEELLNAILSQRERQTNLKGVFDQFYFRTMLTSGYYYYGINYEMSNIDSREIYVMAKSEKLITEAKKGGFVLFEDVMKEVELAFPEINKFFIESDLNKEQANPLIKDFLPEKVYVLNPELKNQFEAYLEKMTGQAIYLRASGNKRFDLVSDRVVNFCEKIRSDKEFRSKLRLSFERNETKKIIPHLDNFKEKNLVVRTLIQELVSSDMDVELKKRISKLVYKIGVPGSGIIQSIRDRDQMLKPKNILKGIKSVDLRKRSRAMRLLKLVRTKNEVRPETMDGYEFWNEFFTYWMQHYDEFSIESHLHFAAALTGKKEAIDSFQKWMNQPINLKLFESYLHYLDQSQSPSLSGFRKKILHFYTEVKAKKKGEAA